jgi:hypothetical protein
LAGHTPLKYVISGKPQIAPEPRIRKFPNQKNTPEDFSDNFHNIKNFVQVDHLEKNYEKPPHFSFFPLPENRRWPKIFKMAKINHILRSDYCIKISGKSENHALQNLSSNTDANFARADNNFGPKC